MGRAERRAPRLPKVVLLVLLVGATAAAIWAAQEQRREASLERAAAMISSSLRLSRQKAVAGDTSYGIKYDDEAFHVYRRQRGDWVLDPPNNRFALPDGVRISSTSTPRDGWIVIDNRGDIQTSAGPVQLRLRDDDGNRLCIRVLGRGRVQESSGW